MALTFANIGSGNSGSGSYWNYSKPDKDGYALSIEGTVVEIAEVPAKKFGTDEIDRWPQGNAKLNAKITLAKDDGTEISWEFKPRTKRDKHSNPLGMSVSLAALFNACTQAGLPGQHLKELLGKYIAISTRERRDSEGNPIGYDVRCPRPFSATIIREGDHTKIHEPALVEYTEEAEPMVTNNMGAAPMYPAPQAQPQQYAVQQPEQQYMSVPQQPVNQTVYYEDQNW